MTKNELKQARKELLSKMHLLREKQEERKNKILINSKEKYNYEIDKMLMEVTINNSKNYLDETTQESREFIDKLVKDLIKMKKIK